MGSSQGEQLSSGLQSRLWTRQRRQKSVWQRKPRELNSTVGVEQLKRLSSDQQGGSKFTRCRVSEPVAVLLKKHLGWRDIAQLIKNSSYSHKDLISCPRSHTLKSWVWCLLGILSQHWEGGGRKLWSSLARRTNLFGEWPEREPVSKDKVADI